MTPTITTITITNIITITTTITITIATTPPNRQTMAPDISA